MQREIVSIQPAEVDLMKVSREAILYGRSDVTRKAAAKGIRPADFR